MQTNANKKWLKQIVILPLLYSFDIIAYHIIYDVNTKRINNINENISMSTLIVESYDNTTINTVLEDMHKKYTVYTKNEHMLPDLPIKRKKLNIEHILSVLRWYIKAQDIM